MSERRALLDLTAAPKVKKMHLTTSFWQTIARSTQIWSRIGDVRPKFPYPQAQKCPHFPFEDNFTFTPRPDDLCLTHVKNQRGIQGDTSPCSLVSVFVSTEPREQRDVSPCRRSDCFSHDLMSFVLRRHPGCNL